MKVAWAADWLPYVRSRAPKYLFGSFLLLIAVAGEFAIPYVIGQILDEYPRIRSLDALKNLGLALGSCSLGMAGGRWIFAREGLSALRWLRAKQRDESFRDANWSDTSTPGECVQRFGADARGAAYLFGTAWLGGANLVFTLALSFWGLMRLSPMPALVITLSWPFLFFFLFRYSRKAKMAFGASRETMRAFSTSLADSLKWLRQTKLLDGAERSSQELHLGSEEVARIGWEARFLALKGEFAGFLMASLSSSLALIWLVNEGQSGRITLGSLVAFLSYLTMGTGAVAQFPGFLNGIRWASICLEHCKAENPEPSFRKAFSARPEATQDFLIRCTKFSLFDWSATLDMTLVRGESVAVVGASGSGKTTLLKIWCGAPLSYSGSLSIQDGRPGLLSLGKAYYAPQWPTIFSGTVRENLALGIDLPDRALWAALEKVELVDEFCAQGRVLQTVLGEGGAGLSTGQKQRLSLARALLRDPSILILDDCLSGVDFTRGARIVSRLQEDFRDRTIVVSGQRDWWRTGSSRQIELPAPRQRTVL